MYEKASKSVNTLKELEAQRDELNKKIEELKAKKVEPRDFFLYREGDYQDWKISTFKECINYEKYDVIHVREVIEDEQLETWTGFANHHTEWGGCWAVYNSKEIAEKQSVLSNKSCVPVTLTWSKEREMKKFNVWTEGYCANGQRGCATFHGVFEGENFKDACKKYIATLDEASQKSYSEERNTFWGCGFFDNETDARRSYG